MPRRRGYRKELLARNPEYAARQRKALYEWRTRNPDRMRLHRRKHVLRKRYGMSVASFDQMLTKQAGECAICGRGLDDARKEIDHNHATGEVRGILCRWCNTGLGYMENLTWRVKAERYLRSRGWGFTHAA